MTEESDLVDTRGDANQKSGDHSNTKKKTNPPDGYVCNLCGVAGHWIQQCSQRDIADAKRKQKRKATSNHEYRPGIDPSPQDIEKAKMMQQLKPPMCDCGIPSRVKKVKRSKVTEHSRANGSYFFFCSKKKDDATKCNFAQPVEELQKTKQDKVQANFFAKRRKKI